MSVQVSTEFMDSMMSAKEGITSNCGNFLRIALTAYLSVLASMIKSSACTGASLQISQTWSK